MTVLPVDRKSIRFLAHMGARGVLGQAVYDLAKDGNEFYVISADLSRASGFERIEKHFPEKLLNAGIAEANMLGMASGLASSGIPVFATTWATFASSRIADQVRNYMGFMKSNVKLIGLDSGFENNKFGYSHTNAQDIAIMSSIPNVLILAPADGLELYLAIISALDYKGPVYIRMTGGQNLPIIHNENYSFNLFQADLLREGKDIVLISNGVILSIVCRVADKLNNLGYSCKVINMHTLNPMDYDVLQGVLSAALIVTVEEHHRNGGLGSMVASYCAEMGCTPPIELIAAKDEFTPAGSYEYALTYNEIDEDSIFDRILKRMRKISVKPSKQIMDDGKFS